MMRLRLPDREPDLEVVALGEAKTKGSTRSFVPERNGEPVRRPNGQLMIVTKNDAGAPAEAWAGIVATATRQAMLSSGFVTVERGVPVAVELVFFRPRPAAHFGTGRNAGVLKASAPGSPAVLPDVDKLARAVLDALKSVAWHDDGQVVGMSAWKAYTGGAARLELRLWRLPSTLRDQAQPDDLVVEQDALFASHDSSPLPLVT